MTAVFPASVEEFVLVPMVNGVAGSAVTIRRSDIEAYEFFPQGTEELLAQVHFADALGVPGVGRMWEPVPEGQRRFAWSISPYMTLSFFDPDSPVRGDVGIRADARYAFASNFVLSGAVTQRLAGNTRGSPRGAPTPGYEPVRTSGALYSSDSPVINTLTLEHFGRPFSNTFTRVSLGYLERMYGGVSAEVLWMPDGSRLALGAEVNHVWRRDPDSLFGVLDYEVTTGHVSAYYDFGNGFLGQVDAGRYLAGDWGATLRLEREFANGWRIGAFATLTDMPFEAFGEGSFDKGITITIPLTWVLGQPSTTANTASLRSLTRDGGARLNIENRLYPAVRDVRSGRITDTWGTVWQ
jgi:hypothetical protein